MSIEKYKFEDIDTDHVYVVSNHFYDKGFVEINFSNGNCFHLYEQDVIALAKHFKLTSDDLL